MRALGPGRSGRRLWPRIITVVGIGCLAIRSQSVPASTRTSALGSSMLPVFGDLDTVRADADLALLSAIRDLVTITMDTTPLSTWIIQAVTVTTVEEVFS